MHRARPLEILFLEPFDGGSHRAFAHGWVAHSRHRITLKTLPPRFWKWRLRGAAFTFAERVPLQYDAVFATSMMNAADFRAAARLDDYPRRTTSGRSGTSSIPLIVYFHENQLSYPRPPDEPLDHGLALASLASAAAADTVVFNSRFHRKEFFRGLGYWLKRFPELAPRRTVAAIRKHTHVIPPGIDWQALAPMAGRRNGVGAPGTPWFDGAQHRAPPASLRSSAPDDGPGRSRQTAHTSSDLPPLILWNHRWEFDKNPNAFFAALEVLADRGWSFRLALLGENTQFVPKPFLAARERFGPRIVQFGYVKSGAAYRRWLGQSDIVVSTAHQENFGIAVAEAVAAGAFPLLPARLSYPEILPPAHHSDCLYRGQSDLVRKLERLLAHPDRLAAGRQARTLSMRRYDWSRIAPRLDDLVERTAGG